MRNKRNIAILICYFGKFPWYFSHFIHSCSYNTNIEFFLVTDNHSEIPFPKNITIIYTSLDDFKIMASEKLGFEVAIDTPYKLCDFKPAYGFIFSELIKEYYFWGFADIDIIFGNINNFITDEILCNYDTICVRHDIISGYFMLFRNEKYITELFKQSKDYEKVFTSPQHFCFDETNFAFDEFKKGIPYYEIDSEIESMNHVIHKLNAQKKIEAYFDFHVIEGVPGRLNWENGTLTYKNKYEVLLYHLIKLKQVYHPKHPWKKIPTSFSISPTRIYKVSPSKKNLE